MIHQSKPQITPAEVGDAAEILAYLRSVGGETDNLLIGPEGHPFTVEKEAAFIEAMRNSPRSMLAVARLDGQVVSVGSLQTQTSPRISHRANVAVSVLKAYWRQGIGRAMMNYLINFARDSAVEIVSLEVRSDNEAAIGLYESLGFERFGCYRDFFKINGHYFDAEYMNLYLGRPRAAEKKELEHD